MTRLVFYLCPLVVCSYFCLLLWSLSGNLPFNTKYKYYCNRFIFGASPKNGARMRKIGNMECFGERKVANLCDR